MKILVTGGSGFIGRNIQESFLKEKYYLLCPSHKELNLCDSVAVSEYMARERPNILIHTASVYKDTLESVHINLKMWINLIQHFNGHRAINLSSGAAFDAERPLINVKEGSLGECIPKDAYGLSKYCIANIKPRRPTYHLHLFSVFGRYEKDTRFITRSVTRIAKGFHPIIKSNRIMDYMYIRDFIKILDAMIEHDHGNSVDYNVTTGEAHSLTQIADEISDIMGSSREYIVCNNDAPCYTGDNTRLLADFPWLEFMPLQDSLRKYIKEDLCL